MNNVNNLDLVSSEIFNKESLNLSFFNTDVIESVLSLNVIEDVDYSINTLRKYRYFSEFFILKVSMDYYIINNSYIDVYYPEFKPLKIADYRVHQRKDKLNKIEDNIDQTKEETGDI